MLKGVYKGFRATYTPLKTTSISGKALCISGGQCKPHTAAITTAWIRSRRVQVLNWPACRPDLSPIGNIWRIIKLKICQQLETHIRQEWDQISTPKLFFFKLAAQVLLKRKVRVEPCLVRAVVLMRGCSGTGEYEAGKEKKSQYTHYKKTRLHHCPDPCSWS